MNNEQYSISWQRKALLIMSVCSGSDSFLQQVRGVVRGSLRPGQRRLGSLQLCDSGQLAGETLLVPRANIKERGRVPPLQWDQWKLPSERVRVIPRPEVDLAEIRGPGLPLQDTAGTGGQSRE